MLVGINLQMFVKMYWMEIIYLFVFLVFIFQLFDFMGKFGIQQWMLFQNCDNVFYVGFGVEQIDYIGIVLQMGFVW